MNTALDATESMPMSETLAETTACREEMEQQHSQKLLQDAIYNDKIRRARLMTATERLDEALELSNGIYAWMLDGAKSQCKVDSDEEGWAEVERRLLILRKLHERKIYKNTAA